MDKLEILEAVKVNEEAIVMVHIEDINKVYGLLKDGENFILEWMENDLKVGKLMIASNIFPKVINEEIIISSK